MAETDYLFDRKQVTIGGGSGHFTLLRGSVKVNRPENITAVPGGHDSGHSSGKLRYRYWILPPGDVRQCRLALIPNEERFKEAFEIFNFRPSQFDDHPFGNMQEMYFMLRYPHNWSEHLNRYLGIRSSIEPATLCQLDLNVESKYNVYASEAEADQRGEDPNFDPKDKIQGVFFNGEPEVNPKAVEALLKADVIIVGPGSLYTSLVPQLHINAIRDAILESQATLVYVSNLMSERGQTDGMRLGEYVQVISRELRDPRRLDYVVVNQNGLTRDRERMYKAKNQNPLRLTPAQERAIKKVAPCAQIVHETIADYGDDERLYRHDEVKLAKTVIPLQR